MIKSNLQADHIVAMKAHDQQKVDTIRYVLSAVKNKEIDMGKELTDPEVIAVMQKLQKELKESIEAFEKGNRTDLMEQYKAQLAVITSYLPAQISDEELQNKIKALMVEYKTQREANPKAFIGIAMKALKPMAEPGRIMAALKTVGAI